MLAVSNASTSTSPLGVVIIGALLTAVLFSLGWGFRQIFAWSKRVNADNAKIIANQAEALAAHAAIDGRVQVLEKGHRKINKVLDKISWIMEQRESAPVVHAATVHVDPAVPHTPPIPRQPKRDRQ